MARRLLVEIVGDARSYERALGRAGRAGQQFDRSFTGRLRSATAAYKGFIAVAGGAVAVAGLKSAVSAASDLNEETAKSEQIFGASARQIDAWSKTASESLKISRTEALGFSSALGAMLKTSGVAGPELAKMSTRLVQLGADMASFNNEDPTEMLQRLRSGLAGEAEPLRRFGVLLSEAAVKTEAYRSGLAKQGAKLTEQQKVQARYNLILAQTADQQGDVARTGDQFAGQQRELRARLADTQAEIGKRLLPVMLELATSFNNAVEAGDRFVGFLRRLNSVGGGTISLPENVTVAQLREARVQVAALKGEGDLMVKALDKAIAKMVETASVFRQASMSGRDAIERSFHRTVLGPRATAGGGGRGGVDLPETTLPFRIRALQARGRDLAAARATAAFIGPVVQTLQALTQSGQLHGKRLAVARKRLLEAMELQTAAQQTIADAQRDAADKQKAAAERRKQAEREAAEKQREAARKHAEEVKRAAEKQRRAAAEVAAKLRDAVDRARQEIGTLFQGPVLAPTDLQRKMRLGMAGPDPAKLLADIRAQTAQAVQFQQLLRRLGRAGVGAATLDELRGLGTEAIPQLQSILGAPAPMRQQIAQALAKREAAAQRIGQMTVTTQRVTLNARNVVVAGGGGRTTQARSGRFAGIPQGTL